MVFRYENERLERKLVPRRLSDYSLSSSQMSATSPESSSSSNDLSIKIGTSKKSVEPQPRINTLPLNSDMRYVTGAATVEEKVVSEFFDDFVMYPCNSESIPGFLEHLPSMFHEVSIGNRIALRWAVQAAAYANLPRDRNPGSSEKAMQCYSLALSALSESLSEPDAVADDYILMTVVVLDLFEVRSSVTLPLVSYGVTHSA
jgi:hypothetical protein